MPILILLAVTVLLTYAVHRDAARRGMHARRWALVMLLTSGLALPVYLLLRKPRQPL